MAGESHLFGIGIIAGLVLAALFDAGRACQSKIPHKGWGISLEDFLFWIFAGLFLFSLLEKYNKGVLRFYVFLGTGIGALFYCCVLHRPVYFCFSKLFAAIGAVFSFIKKIFGEIRKIVKELIIFPLKNVIKEITIVIRNR